VAAGIDDALYTGKGNVGVVKGADGDQPGVGPGVAQLDQQIVQAVNGTAALDQAGVIQAN
jgi:hypothetical protein